MTTITQQGFIIRRFGRWDDKPRFLFYDFEPDPTDGMHIVMPYTLKFVMPADFDPVPQMVAALQKQKEEAGIAYAKTVASINERLAKLQCLTNEVEA